MKNIFANEIGVVNKNPTSRDLKKVEYETTIFPIFTVIKKINKTTNKNL